MLIISTMLWAPGVMHTLKNSLDDSLCHPLALSCQLEQVPHSVGNSVHRVIVQAQVRVEVLKVQQR